jgi:hypothetical protein
MDVTANGAERVFNIFGAEFVMFAMSVLRID